MQRRRLLGRSDALSDAPLSIRSLRLGRPHRRHRRHLLRRGCTLIGSSLRGGDTSLRVGLYGGHRLSRRLSAFRCLGDGGSDHAA